MITEQTICQYCDLLEHELQPALGCTEPIAVAYASAKARELLGCFPDKILVECSGNIIKNVKGVIVPTTGNMRGIDTSAVLGTVGGDPARELETLSAVKPEDIARTKELLQTDFCTVRMLERGNALRVRVTSQKGEERAVVEIAGGHTDIVYLEKNGDILLNNIKADETISAPREIPQLSVKSILEFAENVPIEKVYPMLSRQLLYNLDIANEGLSKRYGANVGATLLEEYGDSVAVRARAYAAAGSDARMSGCVLPVIINSGSGNQGLTVSLPVYIYAKELSVSEEKLYRALCISNLIAIHIKSNLGKLSAFCGAVSAACGAGAAITYLHLGGYEAITDTITNTLANVSGIVCDGAKPSCAAKIASALDAALLAHKLAMHGRNFNAGEGLVMEDIESTIASVGAVGRDGMRETDHEILMIMTGAKVCS